jgi:hypothetical protein
MKKMILLTFEFTPSTRWHYSDDDLAETLQTLGEAAANVHTSGPKPKVTVMEVDPIHAGVGGLVRKGAL